MPNPSIKNERVYRALRRKGYSKERAARISNAMKESATAPLVVAPTGPGGLVSAYGLGPASKRRRKLLARRKAFDEGKIKRDDTGKFSGSEGGGGSSAAERSAKRLAAAEAADKRRAGEAAALAGEKDPKRRAAMRQQFAARRAEERTQARREREAERVGREEASEAKRAEAAKKREARQAAASERKAKLEAKRAEREAAKLKKAEEKKKKGGGGGGKKEPEKTAPLPPLLQSLYGLAQPAGKSFAVTKSADGRHRWILRTTTAYRDRDGEILSEAALDADSRRMAALKQYGPLRYWHMGAPDPADAAAPWGPGVDLGMCDYSQVIGRTRIESGTFYDERVGAAFKAAASQYETSPGFFHTPDQPRAGGVFTHIQTFERSLVPVRLARASNLFTGMHATKERTAMTPEEFRRRAKAFLDDMAAMGVSPDAAQQTLAAAQTAEKAAAAKGIAYKAADAPAVYELPDGTPAIIVEGRLVALKAATVKAPMPPAEMMQAGVTEAADGAAELAAEGEEEAEGDDDGPILGPADVELIAAAVVTKLMGEMGGLQTQLSAFEEELKARGYARMKEAADQLGPKLDSLTRVLGQYVDDLPAAGHRASQDAGTTVAADDPFVGQGALNVGAKSEAAAPATPEAALIRWMEQHGGGALPWDVPGRGALPEGINPAQHAAPGTR